MEKKIRNA